jgi:hypothetical protein
VVSDADLKLRRRIRRPPLGHASMRACEHALPGNGQSFACKRREETSCTWKFPLPPLRHCRPILCGATGAWMLRGLLAQKGGKSGRLLIATMMKRMGIAAPLLQYEHLKTGDKPQYLLISCAKSDHHLAQARPHSHAC